MFLSNALSNGKRRRRQARQTAVQKTSMSLRSGLRLQLLKPRANPACDPWRRYYRFIAALEAKLPIGRERGGLPLVFSWTDAFQPSQHRCEKCKLSY